MSLRLLVIGAVALASPGAVSAQTRAAPPAWVAGGYNNAASSLSQAYATPDLGQAPDRVVINGEIQTQGMSSVAGLFAGLSGGASLSGSGAGFGAPSATAVGNSLSIQVSGSGDTVIVNSVQTNTAAVSATAVTTVK